MLSVRSLFATTTCRCRAVSASRWKSNEATSNEEKPSDVKPAEEKPVHYDPKSIPKPFTHRLRHDPLNFPPPLEKFVEPGMADFSYNRLYDYYKIGEIIESLPTIEEKIAFANPYERPWKRDEQKWHREFMRGLSAPRKAYNLNSIPQYFDVLDFYGFITKTALLKSGIDGYYKDLHLPTSRFEQRAKSSILAVMNEENTEKFDDLSEAAIDRLLRRLLDDALASLPEKKPKFAELRVSHHPRCESFWIKAGFGHLYAYKFVDEVITNRRHMKKIVGDHRQKLGELAFTHRDKFAANVRSKNALPPLLSSVPSEDEIIPLYKLKDALLPRMYSLHPDAEPLWQVPNYEPDSGETHRLAKVAIKSTVGLKDRFKHWNMDEDEEVETREELYKSMAIASLFNWNNGQAHCHGFTQYNDVTRPFTSQLILSNGQEFAFSVGQLNTLAFNVECTGFVNEKFNYVAVNPSAKLFDILEQGEFKFRDEEGKLKSGLNPNVLQSFLRTLCV
ncbi:unnamed protein product [Bursaphelenchus xylophilus]|uniref:(pine wood nematode) hypothetical protein n=1 Tax=Bursaphelenchus xylophilus TaxID=6326 RepID=A0A1I7S0V1_BURXY|nr:unnamed protein product [Bursaphelenchus xylophilus]CAG9088106.1 unnamed protein product [Bursaphelenchus xylophilus]